MASRHMVRADRTSNEHPIGAVQGGIRCKTIRRLATDSQYAVDLYKGEAKLESTRRLPAAETAPGAVAAATAALPKATEEPPPEEPPASNDYPVGPDDGLPMDQDGAGNDYL